METDKIFRDIVTVLLGIIILAISIYYKNNIFLTTAIIFIAITLFINIIVKNIVAYTFEAEITTRFWALRNYGLQKQLHFKKPLPMLWLPILLSFISSGLILWLPVFSFDIKAKPERTSKRHGLYRFTQVTEWHMAIIVMFAIFANLIASIFGYILGFEYFAKLNIFYAMWSLIPLSDLDGSKLLFGSRPLWIITASITSIFFIITIFF